MIADPGERQIGEHLVVLVKSIERIGLRAETIVFSQVSTTPLERPVVPEV